MHLDATLALAHNADNTTDSSSHLQRASPSSPLSRSDLPSDQREGRDGPHVDAAGFVALSRFTVAHMTDQAKQAFQQRPHRVDNATGFVRMEVLSPCDAPNEIWLITFWKDESSFRTWHRSHLYQESHRGIPKGLHLVPKSVSMRFFEHVAS
jgi:heme oxygenase (mycobilin-producing)